MPLITWSQRLSVDVKQSDEQHKKLVGLINDLHDAMKAGKGHEVLGTIFLSMIDYTKTHFADEERLLQAHGYTDLAGQQTSHRQFIKEVDQMFGDFKGGGVVTLTVMGFLKKWLEHHIQVDDKRYGTFLNAKGVR